MPTKAASICGLISLLLAGCATPGPPQPPSLELPRPVTDLAATREGNRVLLTWTPPSETTDKLRIRHPGPTAVCRKIEPDLEKALALATNQNTPQCAPVVGTAAAGAAQLQVATQPNTSAATRPAQAQRASYSVELPPDIIQQNPDGAAVFYIEPQNPSGRGAGYSNPAAVPLAPAFPPPTDFKAESAKTAIVLTWNPLLAQTADRARLTGYRVERSYVSAQTASTQAADERLFVEAGSHSDGHLADTQFAWGKQYRYHIASVTGIFSAEGKQLAEVQGEWSQPVEVATRDVFPPAQPAGLQAVFTQLGAQGFIDLTWLPNSEPDVAGYFVYRRTEGAEPKRLNSEVVKAPAFRDSDVAPGTKYFYSVAAADLRGNEGPRSEEASEVVPKP